MQVTELHAKQARKLAKLMQDWLWAALSTEGRIRLLRSNGFQV